MADPLSMAASMITVVTAAIQSTQSLYQTVKGFKDRDRSLRRLQIELEDLTNILGSLAEATSAETTIFGLLQGPIYRCSQVCGEFKHSLEAFSQKSKTGIRDWAKMEYMRGDMNDFINVVAGYKSTISIGLCTISMNTNTASRQALQDYNELIQDTTYNLEINLRQVEEKMSRFILDSANTPPTSIDTNDEKEVTKECLRICEDLRSCIESRANCGSFLLQDRPQNATEDNMPTCFEAQVLTRQVLEENRVRFTQIIGHLQKRLESLLQNKNPEYDNERERLQHDFDNLKQCLEVCRVAREDCYQNIRRTREATAGEHSGQAVVTTLGELSNIRKTLSRNSSAQVLGSITEETLRALASQRYRGRFGSFSHDASPAEACSPSSPSVVSKRLSKSISRGFRKIRAASSSDDALLMECQEKVPCENCDRITWSEPGRGNRIEPPSNTVAVIVDLISARGAIRIFDQQDTYVDGVGTADAGNLVIVPWDIDWWFYVSGYLTVGFVYGR
jgi:hypothetical protein